MEGPVPPLQSGQALPPKRRSLLAETSPCDTCGKGATESCSSCHRKVCLGCLTTEGICQSCVFINGVQASRDKNTVASKFSSFFMSRKVKPTSSFARTPDRGAHMDSPAGGLFSLPRFLRRGSSSSRNLMAYLDEETRVVGSPADPSRLPRSASRPSLAPSGNSEQGSDEVLQRLFRQVDEYQEKTTKLEKEIQQLKSEKSQKQEAIASTEGAVRETAVAPGELNEAKARVVDLQVQVQEARDEIFRIGAELLNAKERERQLQEYVQAILAQQQQRAAAGGSGGRRRSAIPPCVPFPNTTESLTWLDSIRRGTYQDYWKSAAAQVEADPGDDGVLPPPPMLSLAPTVSANGKPRSAIPPPPPFPPGMIAAPPMTAMQPGSLIGMRTGSCPGHLESLPFQKKREPAFVVEGQRPDMKQLHWTALDKTRVTGTIFEKLVEKPVVKAEILHPQLKSLASRFAKRAAKVDPKSGGAAQAAAAAAPRLQIMDPKRKQQIGIGLSGSFRNITTLELKKSIVSLDLHILTLDRVRMLLEMIPTQEELAQLEGFTAGMLLDQAFFAGMSKEEQFFTDMASIPRLKQRLMCVLMEISFTSMIEQLNEDLDTFSDAIKVLNESQRWKDFLALFLETGNFLNDGNNGLGGAWGFSLKDIKKFSEMKSCENNSRFSLMHWIAEVASIHKAELFNLQEEFGVVSDASTRSVEDLKAEVGTIKRQADIVKAEVEKSKMESSESSTKFLTRMVPFLEQTLLVQLAKIQAKMEDIEKRATQLVIMHGESPQQTNCQQLFHIILEGVASFIKCNEENQAVRFAEQKAMLQQQTSARKMTTTDSENRNMKRDQNTRIAGMATGASKNELEIALARKRKAGQ